VSLDSAADLHNERQGSERAVVSERAPDVSAERLVVQSHRALLIPEYEEGIDRVRHVVRG
jgi:hypothetical protein